MVYIDGLHFGEYCVLGAVGVDAEGHKIVLGIHQGATENAAACKDLLEDLVARGLDPKRKRLFVIDGSKACAPPSTRCSARKPRCKDVVSNKLRHVLKRLPKEQQKQTGALIKSSVEDGSQAGRDEATQNGPVAGVRISRCGCQFAGRNR